MGQDNLCAEGEFCLLSGIREDKTPQFGCVEKLDAGMKCQDDSWCKYPDCEVYNDGEVEFRKCAPER